MVGPTMIASLSDIPELPLAEASKTTLNFFFLVSHGAVNKINLVH